MINMRYRYQADNSYPAQYILQNYSTVEESQLNGFSILKQNLNLCMDSE